MWDCRLFSSTTRPGHTRSISTSLVTTAPRASISATRISNARSPSLVGWPSTSSSRRCGSTWSRPKPALAGWSPPATMLRLYGAIAEIPGFLRKAGARAPLPRPLRSLQVFPARAQEISLAGSPDLRLTGQPADHTRRYLGEAAYQLRRHASGYQLQGEW